MSVTRRGEQSFEVDLSMMGRGGFFQRLWRRPVRVDPHAVAKAVFAVMDECRDRDVRGQRMMWNDYRIFLSQADFDQLAPLVGSLERDLAALLQQRFHESDATVVGGLRVDLMVSEGERLPAGRVVVQAAFVPYATDIKEAGAPGAVTVRADRQAARRPAPEPTRRVADPGAATIGGLRVSWGQHDTAVGVGVRVVLGRPHPDASGSFVPLEGAPNEVNRRQLFIEASTGGGAIVGRLSGANAVQVNGRLIQPGGQLAVAELPVEISLTDGALVLEVEGAHAVGDETTSIPRFGDPGVA